MSRNLKTALAAPLPPIARGTLCLVVNTVHNAGRIVRVCWHIGKVPANGYADAYAVECVAGRLWAPVQRWIAGQWVEFPSSDSARVVVERPKLRPLPDLGEDDEVPESIRRDPMLPVALAMDAWLYTRFARHDDEEVEPNR